MAPKSKLPKTLDTYDKGHVFMNEYKAMCISGAKNKIRTERLK